MSKIFQKIFLWTYIKIHSIMINISIALFNTEQEILKADPNITDEGGKIIQRKRHRNQLLEKFYQGQRDEKYVQDYYELLKKADKFMKKATPHQIAVAADRHGMNYGLKDRYGRSYEHLGFFDGKHKNAGKTLAEALTADYEERRTKDDTYELLYIFNNTPIEVGFVKILDTIKETEKKDVDFEYEVHDIIQKSKQFEFPIKVHRENPDAVNKIEQLTEFLHVKKIGFEYRQLEFFIPLKFKTTEFSDDTDIFKEITDIKEIYINNDYGELMGFGIIKPIKRIIYNNTHEVIKFEGIELEVKKL